MRSHAVKLALATVAITALDAQAHAEDKADSPRKTAWEASRTQTDDSMVTTGVARGRDRLDSATSTSSLQESEITKIGATSLGELFRNIPGIRSEAGAGDTNGSLTIRGLPLVSNGIKYLQLQEDGLPVLQFGDILPFSADSYIRADFNIERVESIRGGSSSTFASNAPGGVINLQSKTGEVEGGSVQASSGLDYDRYRVDFDYGGHLSDSLRFHIGGFYREGDSPRHVGYTAERGGQLKFNITKTFSGGYVRLFGKLLNDRTPLFQYQPMAVSGTNSDPHYADVANFSSVNDSLLSRNISSLPRVDANNQLTSFNLHDGFHALSQSLGLDAKFTVGEWSISERASYGGQSGEISTNVPLFTAPAIAAAFATQGYLGLPATGGQLFYASGPLKGQAITNPAGLNGNGLTVFTAGLYGHVSSLDSFSNDLRVSRVWQVGGGDLTGTAGVYDAHQDLKTEIYLNTFLQDVNGNGNSALIDVVAADGHPVTTAGVVNFDSPVAGNHKIFDVGYDIIAPYGSVNFHKGKVAIGASVRFDSGKVNGTLRQDASGDLTSIDVNRDGVFSDAEKTFPITPITRTTPVNYTYRYASYSFSANYRWSHVLSSFARYSRGGRAAADRILFSSAIGADGSLTNPKAAYDPVQQAEIGAKYRSDNGLFLNATGFWAKVSETNTQLRPDANGVLALVLVQRSYRAFGAEFEGGIQRGPWKLSANATWTDAKITAADDPTIVGNTPRHQAPLIFNVVSQYDSERFSVGAVVTGTASSYAQDTNLLKMPGYATVGAFLQVRPVERVVWSLTVNNLFNTRALTEVTSDSIPASHVVLGSTLYGRTISTALRFYF